MNSIPIITLNIDRMSHTIKMMLSEHSASLDEQTRIAVDLALKPENIAAVIDQQVRQTIHAVISDEIRNAFSYSSAGRAAIREAILEHVDQQYGPRLDATKDQESG